MLWNMVDAEEKTDLYEKAGRVMDGLGLSVLDTFIPDSKRFRKECAEDGNKAVFPLHNPSSRQAVDKGQQHRETC